VFVYIFKHLQQCVSGLFTENSSAISHSSALVDCWEPWSLQFKSNWLQVFVCMEVVTASLVNMLFYMAIDWRDSLYPSDSLFPFTVAELDCVLLVFSFVHLCTFVDMFQIIVLFFILYFLLVPLSCLVLHCLYGLFFARVCLSCVSSLSFNSIIRRIRNPLWNCHTAVVYSSGLIPSICNTVFLFTAYSSASSHSSAVVDSIFVESPGLKLVIQI